MTPYRLKIYTTLREFNTFGLLHYNEKNYIFFPCFIYIFRVFSFLLMIWFHLSTPPYFLALNFKQKKKNRLQM